MRLGDLDPSDEAGSSQNLKNLEILGLNHALDAKPSLENCGRRHLCSEPGPEPKTTCTLSRHVHGVFHVLRKTVMCKVHSVITSLSQCFWVTCSRMRNVATFCGR